VSAKSSGQDEVGPGLTVADVMVRNPLTMEKREFVSHAQRMMEKRGVSRVLVTDRGKLVGIVTERDLIERLSSRRTGKIVPLKLRLAGCMDMRLAGPDRLIVVGPNTKIGEAVRLMVENGVSGLPVVEDGEVVGILTKTDLVRLCLRVRDARVEDVMTKNPMVVSRATSVLNARERLFKESITILPVVEDGKIVGLVAESDIARYLESFRRRAPYRHLSTMIQRLTVEDVMKRDVPTVDVDTPVSEVARIMLERHMKGVPVTDKDGRLVGIVTKTDLTRLVLWRSA